MTRPPSRLLRTGRAGCAGAPGADRRFLEDAFEADVDAICDGNAV